MLYRFRTNLIIRVLLLALGLAGMLYAWPDNKLLAVLSGLLALGSLASIMYFVDQTNRDLVGFLTSIKYNDFTATSTAEHRGKSFGELYEAFNLINRKFQEVRADKEANHQFLQTIVEQIEIGLLCYNEAGEVRLMNKALQRMLRKSFLLHVDGLEQVDPHLLEAIRDSREGKRDLVKITIDNRLLQLAVLTSELRLQDERLFLVSIKNIQNELEEQELDAWQKLIRILTHEIMNSVAPITSLSGTIDAMLSDEPVPDAQTLQDVRQSVQVIQRRGEGLLAFTETYRSLTRIPPPNFQEVSVDKLLERVVTLFQSQAQERGVTLHQHRYPSELNLQADPYLLEQVIINLTKNALDALAEMRIPVSEPAIHLHANRNKQGQIIIQVADNGPGIPPAQLEQIFVPFFTTKTDGSGIGLSLSRQIVRAHKGTIEVQSVVGEGTVVQLVF
ncbi:PAS domain-containing sensor histidine kinase [Lewinella sp. LCG006]|uniref:sensor histidine kinase n=1 Tax=Lewinella sp. LCG006 TaxID=3231911 RepID=UPI0034602C96